MQLDRSGLRLVRLCLEGVTCSRIDYSHPSNITISTLAVSLDMKLINVNTLELHEFIDAEHAPPYAILSHRWEEGEISYEQYMDPAKRHGPGFEKIRRFCQFVRELDFAAYVEDMVGHTIDDRSLYIVEWCWVDTCCIDKRSSAELSESINSMAEWYEMSVYCVAYLSDVPASTDPEIWQSALRKSKWFRRGWTLQELLFPEDVIFCDRDWCPLPDLDRASPIISEITGIPAKCLSKSLTEQRGHYSIACRMSWASNRKTTRIEDEAYCLLGLFDINMPLLYGEGVRAFQRLQEAIIRKSADESILAWTEAFDGRVEDLLARSPSYFAGAGSVFCHEGRPDKIYRLTDRGIEIEADALSFKDEPLRRDFVVIELDCHSYKINEDQKAMAVMIALVSENGDSHRWRRLPGYTSRNRKELISYLRLKCEYVGPLPRQTYLLSTGTYAARHTRASVPAPENLLTINDFHQEFMQKALEARSSGESDLQGSKSTSQLSSSSDAHSVSDTEE